MNQSVITNSYLRARLHKVLGLFMLFFALTALAPAHAAPCGGLNQKACPAWKKGPQCGDWLAKDDKKICRPCGNLNGKACPAIKTGPRCKSGMEAKRGVCVQQAEKASPNFLKQVDDLIKKNAGHIQALAEVRNCMKQDGRKRALKRAYKRRDSAAAQRIVNACVTPDIKNRLRGKPVGLSGRGDPKYFNSLSIGAGAGFIIGGGVSGDAGVIISLDGPGVRFYTSREFAYGLGLSIGADVIVGLSRQQLQVGEDKGRSVTAAGKYLAGGAVSADFSGHQFPNFRNFDGFSVSGGAGLGAEIGTIGKSNAKVH